jgi:hypothetical protein
MSFHGLIAHFVLELGNIPLSGVPHSQLFEGHFGCFQVLAIMHKTVIGLEDPIARVKHPV